MQRWMKVITIICLLSTSFVMLGYKNLPHIHLRGGPEALDRKSKQVQTPVPQRLPLENSHDNEVERMPTQSSFKSTRLWNRPDDNPGYFKRRSRRVTPLDFGFTVSSDVCKKRSHDLMILVLSVAGNRPHRDAIRETWGSVAVNNTWAGFRLLQTVKLVFLFGTTGNVTTDVALKLEASEEHDIVQADFKESYFNLTYKVLIGIKWVKENCPGVKFIMKCDEDSFVNIQLLLERLQLPVWNTRIIGPYFTNEVRFSSGKYAVSSTDYPFKYYPNHVKGNIYILPARTAFDLMDAAEYMPYINMEDVHITGILARCIGATHKAIPANEYLSAGMPGVCEIALRNKLAARAISPPFARQIWSKVVNRKLCK